MNVEFNKTSMLDVTSFDKALLSLTKGSGSTELIRVSSCMPMGFASLYPSCLYSLQAAANQTQPG